MVNLPAPPFRAIYQVVRQKERMTAANIKTKDDDTGAQEDSSFWQIVRDLEKIQSGMQKAHILTQTLRAMTPDKVKWFDEVLQREVALANTMQIREVADLLMGKWLNRSEFVGFCVWYLVSNPNQWRQALALPKEMRQFAIRGRDVVIGGVISTISRLVYQEKTKVALDPISIRIGEPTGERLDSHKDAELYGSLRASMNAVNGLMAFAHRDAYVKRHEKACRRYALKLEEINDADKQAAESTLAAAKSQILNNNQEQAVYLLNKTLLHNRYCAEAFKLRGDIRMQVGDAQAAISDYSMAINCDHHYLRAYQARAKAMTSIGDNLSANYDELKCAYLERAILYIGNKFTLFPSFLNMWANRTFEQKNLSSLTETPTPVEVIGYCGHRTSALQLVNSIKDRLGCNAVLSELDLPEYKVWMVKITICAKITNPSDLEMWVAKVNSLFDEHNCQSIEMAIPDVGALDQTISHLDLKTIFGEPTLLLDFQVEYFFAWQDIQFGDYPSACDHIQNAIELAEEDDDIRTRALSDPVMEKLWDFLRALPDRFGEG